MSRDYAEEREALWATVQRCEQSAWTLAAVALAAQPGLDHGHRLAAVEVLRSLGLPAEAEAAELVAGQAAAPILQIAALLADPAAPWDGQTDEALLAQGRASGQMGEGLQRFVLPHLPELAEALGRPDARMLDVGTGTGALALGMAEAFPHLEVVGIDVLPRALRLAEGVLADRPAGRRVSLRLENVTELADERVFDLVWLPAPFLPETALRAGVTPVLRALRPGGWLLLGHGKYGADPTDDALNRFKTIAFGGTALDDEEARRLLREAGYERVQTVATPPGAPALTVGRRTS